MGALLFSLPISPTAVPPTVLPTPKVAPMLQEYPVLSGSRPHDVAPAPDGAVWYTTQGSGELGRLNPTTGETHHIQLGEGSAPHGVIVGPDGAPWITDGGLNAIARVDPVTEEVQRFPLPAGSGYANLNTASFDAIDQENGTGERRSQVRESSACGIVSPSILVRTCTCPNPTSSTWTA